MARRWSLLPNSIIGRVYALYAISLVVVVAAALGLFYRYQFDVAMIDAQDRAESVAAVISPAVADSAVIGDYDTIRRTLERAVFRSDFSLALFIDTSGGTVRAQRSDPLDIQPPDWLLDAVSSRLFDANLPITVGGRDYGVLRLSFAPERIAAGLWQQTRVAVALALVGLALGVLLIRFPLVRWLGQLSSLEAFGAAMTSGQERSTLPDTSDAPAEFRQTFEVLGRAAATVQAQRTQAAVTLGAIADAVFSLDADGRVLLANPAARTLVSPEGQEGTADPLGRPIAEVLPELFWRQQGLQPWSSRRTRLNRQHAQDQELVVDSTLSLIRTPDGRTEGFVLALHDVSEQHRLNQRLRAELRSREGALVELRAVLESLSREGEGAPVGQDDLTAISIMISGLVRQLKERGEQLAAIFTLSPDGFLSFDGHRQVNYVSPGFIQLTGLSEQEVAGRNEQTIEAMLRDRLETGREWAGFEALRRQTAAADPDVSPPRTLLELARPVRRVLEVGLREGTTEAISQVLSLRDVTHETLVDQMKSEFLSMAAHELRTPMASIFGFAELLMHRKPTPERQREILETIHRQARRMVTIINELLDLARIESRRGLDFELATVDLAVRLPQWLKDFSPPAGRSAPVLDAQLSQALVRMDPQKMEQALVNVLSNAYKYSPEGGEVTVRLVPRRGRPGIDGAAPAVGIEVIDRGIGLSAEQLQRVGDRFWRADASGNIPGTGLGMTIVKEITGLHGGGLDLQSAHGQGTTVTLWLPLLH